MNRAVSKDRFLHFISLGDFFFLLGGKRGFKTYRFAVAVEGLFFFNVPWAMVKMYMCVKM
jgi:hypothetical protein